MKFLVDKAVGLRHGRHRHQCIRRRRSTTTSGRADLVEDLKDPKFAKKLVIPPLNNSLRACMRW